MIKLYNDYSRRTDVATPAPIVTEYEEKNDPNTLDIVEKATDEALLIIKAIDESLTITNKEIVIIGSLKQSKNFYKKTIKRFMFMTPAIRYSMQRKKLHTIQRCLPSSM